MSHEIFSQRFFNRGNRPAWHGLGHTEMIDIGAVEAFDRFIGYHVEKVPMTTGTPVRVYEVNFEDLFKALPILTGRIQMEFNPALGLTLRDASQELFIENVDFGSPVLNADTDVYGLMRSPVEDDPIWRHLGTVTDDYCIVTPHRVCELYDDNIRQSVETIGSLKKGEILFLTTRLPDFTIGAKNDDKIQNYLVIFSPSNGMGAIEVWITSVRVVCWNTLQAASRVATDKFRIPHDRNVEADLAMWLGMLIGRAESRVKALQQAYDMMSQYDFNDEKFTYVTENVYEYPKLPYGFTGEVGQKLTLDNKPDWMPAEKAIRSYVGEYSNYHAGVRKINKARASVQALWDGALTGNDLSTGGKNAWMAWNAITEYETHSGYGSMNQMFGGERYIHTVRAFDLITELLPEPIFDEAELA